VSWPAGAAVPELVEVEFYRRLAGKAALGREVAAVAAPDAWYLKGGLRAEDLNVLVGDRLVGARRWGKLLLLDSEAGPVVGLRFGMTGSLEVDGTAGVDRLLHTTDRQLPGYYRFALAFADGGGLAVRDPRRLGGVQLDPDTGRLGPDALTAGPAAVAAALAASHAPLKARLMDQAHLAGVGNLIADEVLWRSGLDPRRPAGGLSGAEIRRLARHLRGALDDLLNRGGSHAGDMLAERHPGGCCPRDGTPLARGVVGGRTTWWCPRHQV
jgi:formamidopyrimidine-DNA glycosylase